MENFQILFSEEILKFSRNLIILKNNNFNEIHKEFSSP